MDREKEVILVLSALTILHLVESLWFVPWSPLIPIFSILAILLPLRHRTREELGLKRPERWKNFLAHIVLGTVVTVAVGVAISSVYLLIIENLGLKGNIQYDWFVAYQSWGEHILRKFGSALGVVWNILFMLAWAPIGEELLYRGYAFNSLLKKRSFAFASTISVLFFAVRHFFHLVPSFSTPLIVPGLFWSILVIPFGYVTCYVLRKSKPLYATMSIHFLHNLLSGFLLTFVNF